MGCGSCGAVGIPERIPAVCPECLSDDDRTLNIGVVEDRLTFSQVQQRFPELMWFVSHPQASYFTFHLTDFDDLVCLSCIDHLPQVWDGSGWVSWQDYEQAVS